LLATIREAAGDATFVLACGAPIGPCIGHVDAMRASADTAEHWRPKGPDVWGTRWFFARDETNLPGARNMVRSTMARLFMQGALWINDPDCLILRPDFSLHEAQALATVATLSAGSLIFSDSVEEVDSKRIAILKAMLPPLPHVAQYVNLLAPGIPDTVAIELQPTAGAETVGSWHVVGVFNWTDGSEVVDRSIELPFVAPGAFVTPAEAEVAEWHVFEFWSGTYKRHSSAAGRCPLPGIQPRGCQLLAVRPVRPGRPQLVGSDIHVSCGLEVARWEEFPSAVEITFGVCRAVEAPRLCLSLPGSSRAGRAPPRLRGEGSEALPAAEQVYEDVWQVTFPRVDASSTSLFRVEW